MLNPLAQIIFYDYIIVLEKLQHDYFEITMVRKEGADMSSPVVILYFCWETYA